MPPTSRHASELAYTLLDSLHIPTFLETGNWDPLSRMCGRSNYNGSSPRVGQGYMHDVVLFTPSCIQSRLQSWTYLRLD